jgi:multiple sugar transport system ATP-binding protein
MASVTFDKVSKRFDGTYAVKDLDLKIEDREFLVLVGPSGSGKSTALRMLAGLEEITAGDLYIGDRLVNNVAPKDRDISMVFQSYALYPHMSVYDNLAFGLTLKHLHKDEIRKRVEQAAETLGIEELLKRKPRQLSGGQRQRVALGRAIVRHPQVFLLDEPLSNLDAKLRVGMRASLAQLHQRLGVTTVYVTHDQTEAMTLGQRVAVMRDGRVLQCDTPQRLYAQPNDVFIAAFIGSPAMNLVEALVDGDELVLGQYRIPLHPRRRPDQAGPVIVGIRPETFEDAAFAPPELPTIDTEVVVLEELGSDAHVFFRVDASRVAAGLDDDADEATDLITDLGSLLNARVDSGADLRVGSTVELAVDVDRLHYFDPDSGARLAPRPALAGVT